MREVITKNTYATFQSLLWKTQKKRWRKFTTSQYGRLPFGETSKQDVSRSLIRCVSFRVLALRVVHFTTLSVIGWHVPCVRFWSYWRAAPRAFIRAIFVTAAGERCGAVVMLPSLVRM